MRRRNLIPVLAGALATMWGVAVLASGVAPPTPAPPAPAEVPAAAPAAPNGPAPHLAFDSVVVNLGDVVHGQDAVATFSYKNTGDAPLHVLSAKPG